METGFVLRKLKQPLENLLFIALLVSGLVFFHLRSINAQTLSCITSPCNGSCVSDGEPVCNDLNCPRGRASACECFVGSCAGTTNICVVRVCVPRCP